MKEFYYTDRFKKLSQKLPAVQKKKLEKQLLLLASDLRHPSIGVKKMVHQEDIWEARIDKRYRFTFKMKGGMITLRAAGTHEIYKNP